MKWCGHCRGSLSPGMRSDAKFCSERCRVRQHLGYPPLTALYGNARKPDRGARVYLFPEDLEELRKQATRLSPRLRRKLENATDRVAARRGSS